MSLSALTEWLGEGGKPVPPALAQSRAEICLMCVENKEPLWWEKFSTNPIAKAIQKLLSIKSSFDLRVNGEIDLGICRKCGCALPLQVHAPIDHIKNHTPDLSDYPQYCWKRTESKI